MLPNFRTNLKKICEVTYCLSRTEKNSYFKELYGHRRLSRGGRGVRSPPLPINRKFGAVPKNTFTEVFDNTCVIGDFRAYIFRRLKNYLRSTMKQARLNNCLLTHCHKSITDTLDTLKIAKRFGYANDQRKRHFGKSE